MRDVVPGGQPIANANAQRRLAPRLPARFIGRTPEKMTEQDWANSADPVRMLDFVAEHLGQRRLRLFAVACCWRLGSLLDEICRRALEVAVRYADGASSPNDIRSAIHEVERLAPDEPGKRDAIEAVKASLYTCAVADLFLHRPNRAGPSSTRHAQGAFDPPQAFAAFASIHCAYAAAEREAARLPGADREAAAWSEYQSQAILLRDIAGSRFEGCLPVARASVSEFAVQAASTVYGKNVFDSPHLAILAAALEASGSEGRELLTHFKGLRPHVRGCWALDRILGIP